MLAHPWRPCNPSIVSQRQQTPDYLRGTRIQTALLTLRQIGRAQPAIDCGGILTNFPTQPGGRASDPTMLRREASRPSFQIRSERALVNVGGRRIAVFFPRFGRQGDGTFPALRPSGHVAQRRYRPRRTRQETSHSRTGRRRARRSDRQTGGARRDFRRFSPFHRLSRRDARRDLSRRSGAQFGARPRQHRTSSRNFIIFARDPPRRA